MKRGPRRPMPEGLRRRKARVVTFLINYIPHPITHHGIAIAAAGVAWSSP